MNDRRFARVPKILETPKGKDLKEDSDEPCGLEKPAQALTGNRVNVAIDLLRKFGPELDGSSQQPVASHLIVYL